MEQGCFILAWFRFKRPPPGLSRRAHGSPADGVRATLLVFFHPPAASQPALAGWRREGEGRQGRHHSSETFIVAPPRQARWRRLENPWRAESNSPATSPLGCCLSCASALSPATTSRRGTSDSRPGDPWRPSGAGSATRGVVWPGHARCPDLEDGGTMDWRSLLLAPAAWSHARGAAGCAASKAWAARWISAAREAGWRRTRWPP